MPNKSDNRKSQNSEEVQRVRIIGVFLDQAKEHSSFRKTVWKKLCSSLHSNQQVIYLCGVMTQNINMRTEVVKGLNHT